MLPHSPRHLFRELRRRRVFSTLALYVVGAWAALQVAELALPALGLPERAIRHVWFGIFLIFPLVIVFGWRYDVSATGVKRTVATPGGTEIDTRLQRRDFWFIGSLAALALVAVAAMALQISRVKPLPVVVVVPEEHSIAVLPFTVCEERSGDRVLAAGLTGEVIDRLAQRDRLDVIGRVSAARVFESTSSVVNVAKLLGVERLLTGVLCRDGTDLTLNAELIDDKGVVTWKEGFSRLANNYDQVEERLSTLLDNAVASELGDTTTSQSDPAVDRVALEQLILGREYRRQNELQKARAALELSLERQPEYAETMWELALLEHDERIRAADPAETYRDSEAALQKTLDSAVLDAKLHPVSFHAHRVAGSASRYLGDMESDFAYRDVASRDDTVTTKRPSRAMAHWVDSERYYRAALAINPSASRVRESLAVVMGGMGVVKRRESLEILLQGLEIDPFDPRLRQLIALRMAEFGRLREAMEQLDRLQALPQGKNAVWGTQLDILQSYRQFDEELRYLIEWLQSDRGSARRALRHLAQTLAGLDLLGLAREKAELQEALSRVRRANETSDGDVRVLEELKPEDMAKKCSGMSDEEILNAWPIEAGSAAYALWLNGQRERAIGLMEAALPGSVSAVHDPSWEMGSAELLVRMYTAAGRSQDAEPVLRDVVKALQSSVDAGVRHPAILLRLAFARGHLGQKDAALELLDQAVDYGGFDLFICCDDFESERLGSEGNAFPEHWWRGLEEDRRFVLVRAHMRTLVEQQQSNIRSLLKHNDVGALLESLNDGP